MTKEKDTRPRFYRVDFNPYHLTNSADPSDCSTGDTLYPSKEAAQAFIDREVQWHKDYNKKMEKKKERGLPWTYCEWAAYDIVEMIVDTEAVMKEV